MGCAILINFVYFVSLFKATSFCVLFRTHTYIHIYIYITYIHIYIYTYIHIYIYYESQPGSWLVAICERSENRGSGGGGSCQTGQKSGK